MYHHAECVHTEPCLFLFFEFSVREEKFSTVEIHKIHMYSNNHHRRPRLVTCFLSQSFVSLPQPDFVGRALAYVNNSNSMFVNP